MSLQIEVITYTSWSWWVILVHLMAPVCRNMTNLDTKCHPPCEFPP